MIIRQNLTHSTLFGEDKNGPLRDLISLPRSFPLHEKVFSLRSKRFLYRYIVEKRLPAAIGSEFL